jgi:iron-sulfur cluster repair protein YtfE (RIC family)
VRSIRAHHAQLARGLADRVRSVQDAVRDGGDTRAARRGLVAFLVEELMPHAAAEERTLYAVGRAAADGRLLVEAMTEEHRVLAGQLAVLREQSEPIALAATAAQIESLFGVHLYKENELLWPLLLDTGADLRALLHDTHHLLEHR